MRKLNVTHSDCKIIQRKNSLLVQGICIIEMLSDDCNNTCCNPMSDAILIADAVITYNKCETLPSELLKQNEALSECLKELYNSCNPKDVTSDKMFNGINLGKKYVGSKGIPSDEALHKANELLNTLNK